MKYFLLPRKCWYKFWSYYNQWRQRQRWWGASRLSGLFFVSRLHGFLWNSSWWSGTGAGSWLRSGQEEPASSWWSLPSKCSLVSRRSSYAFLLDKSGDLMYYYFKFMKVWWRLPLLYSWALWYEKCWRLHFSTSELL